MPELDEEGRAQNVRASFADFVWGAPGGKQEPLFPALGASFADKPGAGGASVMMLMPGAPAARAGLAVGDVVTTIDGVAIGDKESALFEIGKKTWGDRVAIELLRKGAKVSVSAELKRDEPSPAARK